MLTQPDRIGSDPPHPPPECEEKQVPRALLLTGDAAEELDTMYPYYRVQEGGWEVDVASRTLRDIQLVIHEFDPNSDAYVEKNGRKLPVDVPWADVDVERYDALIIPGGRAPEWIRVDADVRRITEHFFARDLPIALVCHGAQVPAVYGLLKGAGPRASRPSPETWRTPARPSSTPRTAWTATSSPAAVGPTCRSSAGP